MLYLIGAVLSFGAGYGMLHYTENISLPAEKESVMVGAGVSGLLAGIIFTIYGILYMAAKGGVIG